MKWLMIPGTPAEPPNAKSITALPRQCQMASCTWRDIGRIGSINAQTLFLDNRHRVWTTDDYGHLVRYDPERDRLERSPFVLPHNPEFQTGWHSVFYDVAPSPKRDCVYAVTWIANS